MVRATTAVALPSWIKFHAKGVSTDAQLKKLKDLYSSLTKAPTNFFDPEANRPLILILRDQFCQQDLLLHTSKEIRAMLACCIAEFLRLTAPDMPFDNDMAETVFKFFLTILAPSKGSGLAKPDGPLYKDATTLLRCILESQTIVALLDTDAADTLVTEYFSQFIAAAKPEMSREIEMQISQLLSLLIINSDELPKKVTDLLMGLFHPTIRKTNPSASHLAMLTCNNSAAELQVHFAKHYSEAMLKAMAKEDTPELEQALQKIHILISHIYKSAPDTLGMVIPQLEEGLKAQNDTVREACVKTLGQVFSERSSLEGRGGDAAQKNPSTWKAWLGRCQDKSAIIRILWTEAIRGIIVNHAALLKELENYIILKIQDPDEKVRASMVKVFGTLDYDTLRNHISLRLLQAIGERALDPKEVVRSEALEVTGRAYSLAFVDLERQDESAQKQFGWIPEVLITMFTQCGPQVATVTLQSIMFKYIVPLPVAQEEDAARWTNRFLHVYESFEEEEQSQAFIKLCNLIDRRNYFADFVSTCKRFNGGIIDGPPESIMSTKKSLIRVIALVAARLPDPAHAAKELNDFAKINDDRAYKLLNTIIDSQSDLKAYSNALSAFTKKMQANSSRINTTMIAFALMSSFPFVGQSSIPTILSRLQQLDVKKDSKKVVDLHKLIKAMSAIEPRMFQKHVTLLLESALSGTRKVVEPSLMALAKLQASQRDEQIVSMEKSELKQIRKMIVTGSYQEAKYAAMLLSILAKTNAVANSDHAKKDIEELCEEMAHDLNTYDASRLSSSMAALQQFAKHTPNAMMHLGDSLVTKVVQCILTKPWSKENESDAQEAEREELAEREGREDPEAWIEDADINDDLQMRMGAVRFLTQRCLAHKEESEVIQLMVKPVLKLLFACLQNGQPLATMKGKRGVLARMRCVASLSLLKLARNKNCEGSISTADFESFAPIVQDNIWQVRESFMKKLFNYCCKREANLPARYYCLPFLVVVDVDQEPLLAVQQMCQKLASVMTQELRLKYLDVGLARLIHLLSHYPDYQHNQLKGVESLHSVAKYINFYLDCCASPGNLACLHHIALRCKGHQDIMGEEASLMMYRLADLTMLLIKKRAEAFGCTVDNWAGKVNLPSDLFAPMPNREVQKAVYSKSYLSDAEVDELQAQPTKKMSFRVEKRKPMFANAAIEEIKVKKTKRSTTPGKARKKNGTSPEKKKGKSKKRKAREEEEEDDFGSELTDDQIEEDEDDKASQASSNVEDEDKEMEISEDEEIESSSDEAVKGRSSRIKQKQKKEKIARNEDRKRRRLVKEGAIAAAR